MAIIESVASSRRRTKETVRLESMIPAQLREDSEMLTEMLNSYYEFMNLFGHYYKLNDRAFFATVINGQAIFRTESNDYFYDDDLNFSVLYDSQGNEITIGEQHTQILGAENLPDALENAPGVYGTLYNIQDPILENYEQQQLQFVTPIIRYMGDAPSYATNSLLEERDIDTIQSNYLEMIQRELAASIPRSIQSDKKLLYKNITQFYRERGSEESIKIFFQLLLNDLVEIKYPFNDILIPSSGTWDPDYELYNPLEGDTSNDSGAKVLANTGIFEGSKGITIAYLDWTDRDWTLIPSDYTTDINDPETTLVVGAEYDIEFITPTGTYTIRKTFLGHDVRTRYNYNNSTMEYDGFTTFDMPIIPAEDDGNPAIDYNLGVIIGWGGSDETADWYVNRADWVNILFKYVTPYGPGVSYGKYIDNGGFLSDTKKIQDSYFYQKFSYVIRTGTGIETWGNAFNKLIHPAGFKFFGEILMLILLLDKRNAKMPFAQPGLISAEDLALAINMFLTFTDSKFDVKLHNSATLGSVIVENGEVSYIVLDQIGWGYETAPVITITDPSATTVATFTTTINKNGQVNYDDIIQGRKVIYPDTAGADHVQSTISATITQNANAKQVESIRLLDRGLPFSDTGITIEVSAPENGTQATAEPVLRTKANGDVYLIGVNITNPGSGYNIPPTVTVSLDSATHRNRAAEYLQVIEWMDQYNLNKYNDTINHRWHKNLHFRDNTPLFTFETYTLAELGDIDGGFINHLQVGSEIYGGDELNVDVQSVTEYITEYDGVNVNALSAKTFIDTKLGQDHL